MQSYTTLKVNILTIEAVFSEPIFLEMKRSGQFLRGEDVMGVLLDHLKKFQVITDLWVSG